MLEREHEYEKMASVEQKLWWYRALHYFVLSSIRKNVTGQDIKIIDAGCGTGGLMMFLKRHGYTNLQGFDLSEKAVEICRHRLQDVVLANLLDISSLYPLKSADVVISNDTLYFLDEKERDLLIHRFSEVLKPDGLLILNLPALNAFRGIHDLSVGCKHRFSRRDIKCLFGPAHFKIVSRVYWPFWLSPVIYFTRLMQRIKMRGNHGFEVRSDIDLPSPQINKILESITKFENRFFPLKPFGSSLFVVARRRNN